METLPLIFWPQIILSYPVKLLWKVSDNGLNCVKKYFGILLAFAWDTFDQHVFNCINRTVWGDVTEGS